MRIRTTHVPNQKIRELALGDYSAGEGLFAMGERATPYHVSPQKGARTLAGPAAVRISSGETRR